MLTDTQSHQCAVPDGVLLPPYPPQRMSWRLTNRERDVLQFLALRLTNREIASQLHISVRTVESHTASILAKLAVANRREAARYAVQQGLVAHGLGFTAPHVP